MTQRIIGFDIARAFAIFGMVIVNFRLALNAEEGNSLLLIFAYLFEGRASALFVVLAGVGITLMTAKARISGDAAMIRKSRLSLIRRGVLLFLLGLAYTPLWPADILHFYGIYFIIASLLFTMTNRSLFIFSVAIMASFPLMMAVLDYDSGWDWDTLEYVGLWSFSGMLRHLFFNGFHPVFPWCAFLLLGMWLGRQSLSDTKVRKKILRYSIVIWLTIELGFLLLQQVVRELIFPSSEQQTDIISAQDAEALQELYLLLSTAAMPPLPHYILAAGSFAVVVVMSCLYLGDRWATSRIGQGLYQTGKLSLTLYVAHVILGMGILEALGFISEETMQKTQSIDLALVSALLFCLCSILFSVLWLKRFKQGPLEALFRKLVN